MKTLFLIPFIPFIWSNIFIDLSVIEYSLAIGDVCLRAGVKEPVSSLNCFLLHCFSSSVSMLLILKDFLSYFLSSAFQRLLCSAFIFRV